MSALIPPLREKDTPPPKPVDDVQSAGAEVVEAKTKKEADGQGQSQGDVVASFEESSVAPPSKEQTPAYEPTSFLRKYPVSLVNVENLVEEPHDKKSPVILHTSTTRPLARSLPTQPTDHQRLPPDSPIPPL